MSDVATPRGEHDEMAKRWALPQALMGGTRAMRAGKTKFLPQESRETDKAYERRLSRAVLLNEFSRNLSTLSGYVFGKPIEYVVGDEEAQLSEGLRSVVEDVDRDGTPLAEFALEVFEAGATDGLAHILVDFPVNNGDGSRLSDQALVLRPYFVLIKAKDLIGWRTRQVNGRTELDQIRYRTWRETADDEFGSEELVEQIRVRRRADAQDGVEAACEELVFEKDEKDKWSQVGPAQPIKLAYIALATFYAQRTGYLTARPPFEDLAQMNLRWWQSYADQANILHVARVPILHIKGGGEGDEEQEIGANAAWSTGSETEVKWVEHNGRAIAAGRDDLKDIQEWMARMSIETYITRRATTATQAGIEADQSMSLGQLLAVNLGQALTRALGFAADWLDETDSPEVRVNTSFGLRRADQATVVALNAARDRGDLSRRDYLEQLARINVVEDLDLEANDARLELEEGRGLDDEDDNTGDGGGAVSPDGRPRDNDGVSGAAA